MNLVLKATRFADKAHKGQTRKVSGDEYFTHPLAVSYIVAAFKQSKRLDSILAACVLHDVVEDCNISYEEILKEFGMQVASLVFELTSDKAEIARVGKLEYFKKKLVGMTSYALVIKLADRLHNMSDSPTAKIVSDTEELINHITSNRKLSKTHKALIKEIMSLVEEYKRIS